MDAVIIFDIKTLRVVGADAAAAKVFGYAAEEWPGKPILDLLLPHGARQKKLFQDHLGTGQSIRYQGRRKDGSIFAMEAAVTIFRTTRDAFYAASLKDLSVGEENDSPFEKTVIRFHSFFENTGTAGVVFKEDLTIHEVNQRFCQLSGLDRSSIEGRQKITDYFPAEDWPGLLDLIFRNAENPAFMPLNFETRFQDNHQASKPYLVTLSAIPGTRRAAASLIDLSPLRQAEASLAKQQAYFSQLFENSPQAIVMVDAAGSILNVNRAFESLFGCAADEIRNRNALQVAVPEALASEAESCHRVVLAGQTVEKETERQSRDGRRIPVSLLGYPIRIGGEIAGAYFIYNDISERKTFEAEISRRSLYDALTGLPNRLLMQERLDHALTIRKRRQDYNFALLLVDLDRFKSINDSLGHRVGDRLINQVGRQIKENVRTADTVARLGGDEFGILIEEFASPREVILVAKRIQKALFGPYKLDGRDIHVNASIGMVLKTGHYRESQDIIRDADIAMYRAKEIGGGRFRVFSPTMHAQALQSLQLETELRQAIENREFTLFYQPIYQTDDLGLVGLEALVRWNHPQKGLTSPDKFIPMADETGLIVPLGRWILEEACRQMKQWQEDMPAAHHLSVNVNVSSKQLMHPDTVGFVARTLKDTGLAARHLKLEITESVWIADDKATQERLEILRALGVQLAIDDFGTGYSSLSYLQRLPVHYVKIDRSFTAAMGRSEEDRTIVKTIIDLANHLGLKVVAEGVEREDQLASLKQVHCHEVQGYYFSRPVDAETAGNLIRRETARPPRTDPVFEIRLVQSPVQGR